MTRKKSSLVIAAAATLAAAVILLRINIDHSPPRNAIGLSWGTPKPGTTYTAEGYPREVLHTWTGIEMAFIPAGTFLMGQDPDGDRDERPPHQVTMTTPFYLAKYETSNRVFKKWRPNHHSHDYKGQSLDGDEQPVVYVSWIAVNAFCEANDLRLPTEAEWEYAARAGATTAYPWGDNPNDGKGWGNVLGPSTKAKFKYDLVSFLFDDGVDVTADVGRYRANGFGLHDVIGNVWEWCSDWYDPNYYASAAARHDPRGPSSGDSRVLRGGTWNNEPRACRVSNRSSLEPRGNDDYLGFRAARDL